MADDTATQTQNSAMTPEQIKEIVTNSVRMYGYLRDVSNGKGKKFDVDGNISHYLEDQLQALDRLASFTDKAKKKEIKKRISQLKKDKIKPQDMRDFSTEVAELFAESISGALTENAAQGEDFSAATNISAINKNIGFLKQKFDELVGQSSQFYTDFLNSEENQSVDSVASEPLTLENIDIAAAANIYKPEFENNPAVIALKAKVDELSSEKEQPDAPHARFLAAAKDFYQEATSLNRDENLESAENFKQNWNAFYELYKAAMDSVPQEPTPETDIPNVVDAVDEDALANPQGRAKSGMTYTLQIPRSGPYAEFSPAVAEPETENLAVQEKIAKTPSLRNEAFSMPDTLDSVALNITNSEKLNAAGLTPSSILAKGLSLEAFSDDDLSKYNDADLDKLLDERAKLWRSFHRFLGAMGVDPDSYNLRPNMISKMDLVADKLQEYAEIENPSAEQIATVDAMIAAYKAFDQQLDSSVSLADDIELRSEETLQPTSFDELAIPRTAAEAAALEAENTPEPETENTENWILAGLEARGVTPVNVYDVFTSAYRAFHADTTIYSDADAEKLNANKQEIQDQMKEMLSVTGQHENSYFDYFYGFSETGFTDSHAKNQLNPEENFIIKKAYEKFDRYIKELMENKDGSCSEAALAEIADRLVLEFSELQRMTAAFSATRAQLNKGLEKAVEAAEPASPAAEPTPTEAEAEGSPFPAVAGRPDVADDDVLWGADALAAAALGAQEPAQREPGVYRPMNDSPQQQQQPQKTKIDTSQTHKKSFSNFLFNNSALVSGIGAFAGAVSLGLVLRGIFVALGATMFGPLGIMLGAVIGGVLTKAVINKAQGQKWNAGMGLNSTSGALFWSATLIGGVAGLAAVGELSTLTNAASANGSLVLPLGDAVMPSGLESAAGTEALAGTESAVTARPEMYYDFRDIIGPDVAPAHEFTGALATTSPETMAQVSDLLGVPADDAASFNEAMNNLSKVEAQQIKDLAMETLNGLNGQAVNPDLARELYEVAAANGNLQAQADLAYMQYHGLSTFDANPEVAVQQWEAIADKSALARSMLESVQGTASSVDIASAPIAADPFAMPDVSNLNLAQAEILNGYTDTLMGYPVDGIDFSAIYNPETKEFEVFIPVGDGIERIDATSDYQPYEQIVKEMAQRDLASDLTAASSTAVEPTTVQPASTNVQKSPVDLRFINKGAVFNA